MSQQSILSYVRRNAPPMRWERKRKGAASALRTSMEFQFNAWRRD
jgi:hypothetical protein